MDTPRIRYTTTDDGVDIAYAVLGADNPGPPVLVLNALASAGIDAMLQSETALATFSTLSHYRPVVVFDWRGLGVSGASSEFSMDGLRADICAVADALGTPQFDILGRLGPSHLGAEFAARFPDRVRRLALINPSVPGYSPRQHPRMGPLYTLVASGGIDWSLFCEILALVTAGWHDTEFAKALFQRLNERFDAATFDRLLDVAERMDARDCAGEVRCPTLVYFMGQPPVEMRAMAGSMQNADVVIEPPPRGQWLPWANSGVAELPKPVADFLLADEPRTNEASPGSFRTILFTDVVSSTPLLTQLRDARMREVMRDHDAVMEAAVTGHGGRVIKTIGDAFMAEFAVPSAAVEAAIEAQRASGTGSPILTSQCASASASTPESPSKRMATSTAPASSSPSAWSRPPTPTASSSATSSNRWSPARTSTSRTAARWS